MDLTVTEQSALLGVVRSALQAVVKTGGLPDFALRSPALNQAAGAIVTLRGPGPASHSSGSLATGEPLYRLALRLIDSAARDEDGVVMPAEELHLVRLTVSALLDMAPFSPADAIADGLTGLAMEGDPPTVMLPDELGQARRPVVEILGELCARAGLGEDAWEHGAPVQRFKLMSIAEEW
jgi:AMMECR1 domain-containing protein